MTLSRTINRTPSAALPHRSQPEGAFQTEYSAEVSSSWSSRRSGDDKRRMRARSTAQATRDHDEGGRCW